MTESAARIARPLFSAVRAIRWHRVLKGFLLAGVVAGLVSGCAHDPDRKKKKRKPKHRDPVEQKIFYDGWWPRR
ncbi:MAG: hypothetical protein K1X78_21320 [Verrucomicrobiaceae bacterium]|nr:hypothetical protein [Verrucomicrobiaceae bacterium]